MIHRCVLCLCSVALQGLAIEPREEAPAMAAELSDPEELCDISADELDETTASRAAMGLRSRAMGAISTESRLFVTPSRDVSPEPAQDMQWQTPARASQVSICELSVLRDCRAQPQLLRSEMLPH